MWDQTPTWRVCGSALCRLLAIGSVAIVLCARSVAAQEAGPTVRDVDFECNAWVDKKGLARMLPLRVGEPLAKNALAESRRRLEKTDIFRSVTLEVEDLDDGVRIVVHLDRKPVIARVNIEGYGGIQLREFRWLLDKVSGGRLGGYREDHLGRVEIRRLVRLREGMIFEPEMVQAAEGRIVEHFSKLGYPQARVYSHVRERAGTVDIDLSIERGEAVIVEDVVFGGSSCLSAEQWEPVLSEFRGRPRARDAVRSVRKVLLHELREQRFYEARVRTRWVKKEARGGLIRADVECGARFELDVVGNEHVDQDDLLAVVDLPERLVISDSTWRLMARQMEELYQEKGFYEVSVQSRTSGDDALRRVEFDVEEGRKYRVRSTHFTGNEHVGARALRAQMATRKARLFPWPRGGAVVAGDLKEDMGRIEALYRSRGFESAQASADVVKRGDGDLELEVTIEEGPRTIVRRIEPADFPAPVTLDEALAVTAGKPLQPPDLDHDRDLVVAAWRELGHRDVRVDVEVERQRGEKEVAAVVHWKVEAGPRYRVGPIIVQENVEVKNDLLLREMPFSTGDPLRTRDLLAGQERLYSLGLFRTATVEEIEQKGEEKEGVSVEVPQEALPPSPQDAVPPPGDVQQGEATAADEEAEPPVESADVVLPVAIEVTPRAPGRLWYGLGYNTRDGFTGFAEMSYDNVAHRARSVRLRGELSIEPPKFDPSQFLLGLTYADPRFSGSAWEVQLGAIAERDTNSLNEFSIERAALSSTATREIFDRLRVGGDVQLEFANVFDVDPLPFRDRDSENSRTTAVGVFAAYDRRNDAFNPVSGFINSLRLHYAPPGLSSVDFVQIDAEHTHFLPLGSYAGLVFSLRAGWVRTFDDPIVPIRRRYFVGGGESVRGFAVNSLGPYDGENNDVGGDLAIVAKTELRVPIKWGFGIALFVDSGANYLLRCGSACRSDDGTDDAARVRDADPTFHNLRYTAGLGLRYISPVGPISVDYGVKLDRRRRHLSDGKSERESFGEFSISIGARF